MNKICFLDIDGVLNPTMYSNVLYKIWKTNSLCKSRDEFGDYFAPWCIDYLYKIINDTQTDIVISSSWRRSGLKIMKEMWDYRRLPGKIIDVTPNEQDVCKDTDNGHDYYDQINRGAEIDLWIRRNNFKGNYVIIDDTPDMLPQQSKYFVQTDSRIGLTLQDAQNCIEILNR